MPYLRNVFGIEKFLLLQRIKLHIFFYYLKDVFSAKISLLNFISLLRRLSLFLSKLKSNKFFKVGDRTKMDLYVPGFPSPSFYTACNKFSVFQGKLPCTTVLISITSACKYRCSHCYQRHDKGKDVDLAVLIPVIKRLQSQGIAFFNIEGGEPFLVYDRLRKVCSSIDERSEIWINTTGDGVTLERLKELKKLHVTALMFSLHAAVAQSFNTFMGSEKAWAVMTRAVACCHQAGIPVAFNICLHRDAFYNGSFEDVMECAKKLGASMVQLIKPKPAGAWLGQPSEDFSEADLQQVKKLVHKYNHDNEYLTFPSISSQIIEEDKNMFGCTAGGTDRFYINAKGDVQPCEFLNISFGNITTESFEKIYSSMREYFHTPTDCWICEKYSGKIFEVYEKNQAAVLPLSPELSKTVYQNWDRGEATDLYLKLDKIH